MRLDLPRAARWLAFAAVVTGCAALLLGLPQPFASLLLGLVLAASAMLALHRAGAPVHEAAIGGARAAGRAAQALAQPFIWTALAMWRFNRQSFGGDLAAARPKPQPEGPPTAVSWLAGFAIFSGALLALAFGLAAGGLALLAWRLRLVALAPARAVWRHALRPALAPDTPAALPSIPRPLLLIELTLITITAIWATQRYLLAPPNLQFSGGEAEWITNSVYLAHFGLRDYGRIPLWQPWIEFGEPLLDNPVGFVLNPFGSVPSLILGGARGLKLSVTMTTLVAGLGGWWLARILGLSWPARLLLGALLIGKGNMSAMFNAGYFQLASQQAFFPWIAAGMVGLFRFPRARWPVVMTALSFALVLFAGNVWYALPMLVLMGTLALAHHFGLGRPPIGLRRLLLAVALTLGISAVWALPLAINWGQIGRHPPEVKAGWEVTLRRAVQFYFNPDPRQPLWVYDPKRDLWREFYMDGMDEFYYSFVAPAGFVALLALLPLYRPRDRRHRRLILAAWALLALFTLWGAGGQPLFVWLYDILPPLRGWRFVGRALAVGSFLLALLLAIRLDSLWRSLRETDWQAYFPNRPAGVRLARWLPRAALVGLVVSASAAAYQVNRQWDADMSDRLNPIHKDDECVSWLRAQHPDQELAVWRWGYTAITTYLNNNVRKWRVHADFEMRPMQATLGRIDLTTSLPPYGIAWTQSEKDYLRTQNYRIIPDSPFVREANAPCLYYKPDALAYAYTVPVRLLQRMGYQEPPAYVTLPPAITTPVTRYERQPDAIALIAYADPYDEQVLTLQERAYPGWMVTVDGQPVRLESVGGQIGVRLPPGTGAHQVVFMYRPPLLLAGAMITLASAAFSIGYLLRVDRWLRHKRSA